ncbi:hypothetical protein B0F90DRAFT_1669047 [Multifurca ochricompacta]|uniref:Uncharacterized protein n=1 Tax=Multifurca ochricompacta TaxID=376703 RepID=A0AAD4M315_9AGAM|nr:hypothetical protein B0F90DRAFT_1669047 [Multifurca ochricompacta]
MTRVMHTLAFVFHRREKGCRAHSGSSHESGGQQWASPMTWTSSQWGRGEGEPPDNGNPSFVERRKKKRVPMSNQFNSRKTCNHLRTRGPERLGTTPPPPPTRLDDLGAPIRWVCTSGFTIYRNLSRLMSAIGEVEVEGGCERLGLGTLDRSKKEAGVSWTTWVGQSRRKVTVNVNGSTVGWEWGMGDGRMGDGDRDER